MDAKLATALPCGWNGIQIRWRHRDRSTDLRVLVIKRAIHGHQHVESVSSYGILWHGVEIEVPALVRNTESLYMQDYTVYIQYTSYTKTLQVSVLKLVSGVTNIHSFHWCFHWSISQHWGSGHRPGKPSPRPCRSEARSPLPGVVLFVDPAARSCQGCEIPGSSP